MAARYNVGTPIRGERKMRRMHSPFQDFMTDTAIDGEPEPTTPRADVMQSSPVTLQAMSDLLDSKFGPVQKQIAELESKLKDHQDSVARETNRIMAVVEGTIDGLTVRVAKLEEVSFEAQKLLDRLRAVAGG